MGGGNGAKAQRARQRNAEKNATKTAASQIKSNEKARKIVCNICRNPFLVTVRPPELEQHAQNKHSKTMAECFPDVPR